LLLGPERLYRYATTFGFGGITGVTFPGEAGGKLRSPEHWSQRSCPTIAIGHELSVTPIQLALAYGVIANGGILMQPMLVREIRNSDGTVVRRFAPHATQRALSARTTELLRTMLTAVVDSGTAKAARVPGLAIAGKTGTAQKYDAAFGTYAPGKYLSSFVGFAPADNPTLVGVVVIDEPGGKHYYGGEVAAPVFREILLDLQRLSREEFHGNLTAVASEPAAPAPVVVPDVHLLPPDAASRRLGEYGLHARLEGSGARVLAQDPAAGSEFERGGAVTLWLTTPQDSAGRVLPDVTQLPVREALRRLARLEVHARIEGQGTVVRQQPPPGTRLPVAAGCRLWCEPVRARPITASLEPSRLVAAGPRVTP
jgi:stage V sporulation protein D (sporulation-specific penicillin-binding protein)